MKCAVKFACLLAVLHGPGLEQVEADFVVQPNNVATTGLVSAFDGFHVVLYGTGFLPTIVNTSMIAADFEGGITPRTIAVSSFSGSFSDQALGRPIITTSAAGNASALARVTVSGPDESYYVQNSISVNGFVAPGDTVTIGGSYTVTNGGNVTYYQNVFNFQLPVQGEFRFNITDPSHIFADYLGNNISQLRVNASFGATFANSSAVAPSHVNFGGFVLVTTVPEPSSIRLLPVSLATLAGFLGLRKARRPRPAGA